MPYLSALEISHNRYTYVLLTFYLLSSHNESNTDRGDSTGGAVQLRIGGEVGNHRFTCFIIKVNFKNRCYLTGSLDFTVMSLVQFKIYFSRTYYVKYIFSMT